MSGNLTPEYVEKLLDEAGRDAVFARARDLGWADGGAPLWVWKEIAAELIFEKLKAKE